MSRAKRERTNDLGLSFGYLLGQELFGMQDLHYGLWDSNLPVEFVNLPKAQSAYSEKLLACIPEGVKTILDVGCGSGSTAKRLIEAGYSVQCVSPSPKLTAVARERLGPSIAIHECKFEELDLPIQFDLLLFSESFQYVDLELALPKIAAMLNSNGFLLLSDFFDIPGKGRSPIGGGHDFGRFQDLMRQQPFELDLDDDLTQKIAPTMDLVNRLFMRVLRPAYLEAKETFAIRRPKLSKMVNWRLRNKIDKLEDRHFSGKRTGAAFAEFKTYRIQRYRRI